MMPATSNLYTPVAGPAVEREVALDLGRRGLMVAPGLLVVAGLFWGWHGVASSAYGVALVLANFVAAALLLAWAARVSLGAFMIAALGGYIVRLALLFAAVWVVHRAPWASMVPLALTLGVTHLGLLVWEARYVSATLAYPGLKPPPARPADRTPKGA
jgi:hypothetical protein